MKWDYHVRVELDTNDADYIHNDYRFGTYDDENEQDMKSLAVDVLVYNNFEVDDGYNIFYVSSFLDKLKEFDLKPSDRCEDWKKYDCLLDYDSDAFENLDDFEDYEDEDEEDDNAEVVVLEHGKIYDCSYFDDDTNGCSIRLKAVTRKGELVLKELDCSKVHKKTEFLLH